MDQRRAELARTMRALGMWRQVSGTEADAAQRSVAEGGYPFDSASEDPGYDWFFVDGEEMAEGQIENQLAEIRPRLRELGVDLVAESRPPAPRSSMSGRWAEVGDSVRAVGQRARKWPWGVPRGLPFS
ncbi:hypothetical protein [Actinoplanes sp. L3-i22]|uniref:hypothetical protein n=1 Tax=Actinoplanes sp. L3-i22 TaxID=2836373 RepID=UPI001C84E81D|nr:hypothetical protein [Actinoplanes sp. L3-i22]